MNKKTVIIIVWVAISCGIGGKITLLTSEEIKEYESLYKDTTAQLCSVDISKDKKNLIGITCDNCKLKLFSIEELLVKLVKQFSIEAFREIEEDLEFSGCSMSPDKKYVICWIFFYDEPNFYDIYLYDLQRSSPEYLSRSIMFDGYMFAWSPNNKYIAVNACVEIPVPVDDTGEVEWPVPVSIINVVNVTAPKKSVIVANHSPTEMNAYSPEWSPDGQKLYYKIRQLGVRKKEESSSVEMKKFLEQLGEPRKVEEIYPGKSPREIFKQLKIEYIKKWNIFQEKFLTLLELYGQGRIGWDELHVDFSIEHDPHDMKKMTIELEEIKEQIRSLDIPESKIETFLENPDIVGKKKFDKKREELEKKYPKVREFFDMAGE
ncbi:MAG: hypothetical protein AB1349_05805 [Elusimicrobiota bacterium]